MLNINQNLIQLLSEYTSDDEFLKNVISDTDSDIGVLGYQIGDVFIGLTDKEQSKTLFIVRSLLDLTIALEAVIVLFKQEKDKEYVKIALENAGSDMSQNLNNFVLTNFEDTDLEVLNGVLKDTLSILGLMPHSPKVNAEVLYYYLTDKQIVDVISTLEWE